MIDNTHIDKLDKATQSWNSDKDKDKDMKQWHCTDFINTLTACRHGEFTCRMCTNLLISIRQVNVCDFDGNMSTCRIYKVITILWHYALITGYNIKTKILQKCSKMKRILILISFEYSVLLFSIHTINNSSIRSNNYINTDY